MLGGIFNALVAPLLFTPILEYPLVLLLAAFALPGEGIPQRLNRRRFGFAVGGILLAGLIFGGAGRAGRTIHAERSFFGISRVIRYEQAGRTYHSLVHGTTRHGLQNRAGAERTTPLLYYHPAGPAGDIMAYVEERFPAARIGAVGLGSGAMAAYGRENQRWTFFEIDPAVTDIAEDSSFFSYLSESEASVEVIPGDGRLSLAGYGAGTFDLIILDAYSSDAIPVHTITREAVVMYLLRLSQGGLLAFHISNSHLDLEPVLGVLSRTTGCAAMIRIDDSIPPEEQRQGRASSSWVVMAFQGDDLAPFARNRAWRVVEAPPDFPLWTDDYSSLLSVLRR
jgi:hypothetical protein